ncbi:aldo/keto reductase [Devosia salina]|uniref:Aldo/keto reductase n=1 Tax=Devosia salina TaxID=2860336 RepID=A0ABX8WG88_9HYPH|nr:aldo/keto reductase [Devosia salina]QYO77773.1 aldo/keto reductase [Devosia salina]
MSRLVLGTAQFGLAYGITNATGRVSPGEAKAILDLAAEAGIDEIDTAALYGDSESTLGQLVPAHRGIVTKTSKIEAGMSDAEAVKLLEDTFAQSLERLETKSVKALLVHESEDLLGPCGPALWQAMSRLKAAGLTRQIGASVYTGQQIDALSALYDLDIVQLPFNVVDKRLIAGGQLDHLASAGVEVHCRSVFLQGLLLQEPAAIPDRFGELAAVVGKLRDIFNRYGLTPLEGLLAATLETTGNARLVVGVTSTRELEQMVAAEGRAALFFAGGGRLAEDLRGIAISDQRILSPALWGQLVDSKLSAKD